MIKQRTMYFKCGDKKSNWLTVEDHKKNSIKTTIELYLRKGYIIKWQFTDMFGSLFIFEKRDK